MVDAPVRFGRFSTADEVLAGRDLSGRTYVITGGSAGLGRETVRALASAGATILFTGRDEQRARALAAEIGAEAGAGKVESAALDLMSIKSVSAFAAHARARFPKLDGLILNAGVMTPNLERGDLGIEMQLMTNYVGHLLLTSELVGPLKAAAPARIISLTSSGHKYANVDFDDPNFDRRPYDGMVSYGQSKTASALQAIELNRRLSGAGVIAIAVHPGVILETELSRYVGGAVGPDQAETMGIPRGQLKNIPQGASSTVWALTSDDPALVKGGVYVEDCAVAAVREGSGSHEGLAPHAIDSAAATRLFEVARAMLGPHGSRLDALAA